MRSAMHRLPTKLKGSQEQDIGTGGNSSNNKHVDIKEKHVQDRVQKGEVRVKSVGTNDHVADAFTKPLSNVTFGKHYQFGGNFAIRSIAATFTS